MGSILACFVVLSSAGYWTMVFFVLAVRRGLGSILLWGAREYWRIFCRFTMLKLFSPHHCVGFLFPTSLCGDLVFRMHPAGASAASAAASPSAASCSLTHSLTHSSTHALTHSRSTESFLAAFRVAGAVHRASWRSCGARGRRWGRGCLSRARRSTQRYTEPPGGAAARVVAAGAAAACRVAGAVHRAS